MLISQIAHLGIHVEAVGPDAARRKLDAMERSGVKAERTVESLGRSSSQASGRIQTMATSSNLLAGALASVGAALSIREIVRYTDTWTNLTNRLRLVTDGTQELVDVQQSLVEIAFDTRGSLDSTAVLYQRLAQSGEHLFESQEDILAVTKTINQAMLVSGASAQESAGALRQLAQGLASGVLRGDEFNSVMENAPRLQKALVDYLDLTSDAAGAANGKLRQMAGDGELSAETLVKAFQAAAKDIDKEASLMNTAIGQSLTNLNTGITATIGQLDSVTGASKSVAGAIEALAKKLTSFGNDAEAVRDVAGGMEFVLTAVAAILAGKFAGAISKQIVQMGLLNAATYKTTIQTNALGQAVGRTTIATRAATVAATGLKSAFAFMGGPVGVITVAALSLATWSSGAEAAEKRAESLSGKISQLERKYKDLTAAQREAIKLEIAEEKRSINKKIASLVERRTNLQYGATNTNDGIRRVDNSSQIIKINSQIDTLNQSLQEAEERLANLGKPKAKTEDGEPLPLAPVGRELGTNSSSVRDDLPALERALQEQFDRTVQKRLDMVENLRQSLLTEEEALAESYRRRQRIIEENVHDPEKREDLLQRNKDQYSEEVSQRVLSGFGDNHEQLSIDDQIELINQEHERRRNALLENTELTANERYALEWELEQRRIKMIDELEKQHSKNRLRAGAQTFSALADLTAQFAGEQSGIYKTLFGISKAYAIAEAAVAMSQNIAQASKAGFPQNIPLIIGATTQGLQIASQLNSIKEPSYAGAFDNGGNIPAGQWGIVGEYGPEIVNGPAQVTSRRETAKMLNQQSSIIVNLIEDASRAGQVERSQGVGESDVINIFVANIREGGDAAAAIESTYNVSRTGF
ncbi:tape measure protein [Microbulbifer variabilis]|uniref:tape measure protein n=1 Tax=Microbulbifer variabilis TaxID=266805 RepID=UPI001CFEC6AB|nr:tape measure protein [Microbulbifer variabilis]